MGHYTQEILSDVDLLVMEQRHVPYPPITGPCDCCGQPFPCDTRRCLNHIYATRRAFRVLGKHKRSSV